MKCISHERLYLFLKGLITMIFVEGHTTLLKGQVLEGAGASAQPHTRCDLEQITLPPRSNLLNGHKPDT